MEAELKVGYVPINEDPCSKCCLSNLGCPMEGFCKCDQYWHDHPEDPRNEDSEVYFIRIDLTPEKREGVDGTTLI
jgi:hypothetical protein